MLLIAILCVVVPLSSQQCLTPRDEVRKVRADVQDSLLASELKFSTDMIQTVSTMQGHKNVFFSPTSVFQALLMTYFISAKQTEASLKKTMHLDANLDKLDYLGAYNLENYYQKLRSIKKSGCQMNLANRLYTAKQLKVQQCLKVLFSDELQTANFRTNVDGARRKINQWVASQTNKAIKDFLTEEYLSKDTQLVLLNAAHFKGSWKTEFKEEDTHQDTFFLNNGTEVDCQMMVQESQFKMNINEKLDAEVLELPYKNGDISMFLMLPQKVTATSLQDMLKRMDGPTLKSMVSSLQADENLDEVTVVIPKFTLEETLELTPILDQMGVGDLFQKTADLSVLTGSKNIYITDAIHKAKIKVDEKGTEAAAATAFSAARMGSPIFRADRPFAYMLYDKTSDKLLFFGVFNSPP